MKAYVGFAPCDDPGARKTVRGRRRTRNKVVEVIPIHSMTWRIGHPAAEATAFGRRLAWDTKHPTPEWVEAYGSHAGFRLMSYYLVDWPQLSDESWPQLAADYA